MCIRIREVAKGPREKGTLDRKRWATSVFRWLYKSIVALLSPCMVVHGPSSWWAGRDPCKGGRMKLKSGAQSASRYGQPKDDLGRAAWRCGREPESTRQTPKWVLTSNQATVGTSASRSFVLASRLGHFDLDRMDRMDLYSPKHPFSLVSINCW